MSGRHPIPPCRVCGKPLIQHKGIEPLCQEAHDKDQIIEWAAKEIGALRGILQEAHSHLNYYDPETAASGIGHRITLALETKPTDRWPEENRAKLR